MSEKAEQNQALIDLSALDETMVWQNSTGTAWQGKTVDVAPGGYVRVEPGMKVLRNARPIRFGLEGSGDILGAVRRRPLAVEMKSLTGRQRVTQQHFERAWVKAGGIYILARSADEAVSTVKSTLC